MDAYIFIYEGFAQFEVVLASYLLKTKGTIITVGEDLKQIESYEGFQITPHKRLSDIKPEEVDIFIIPGGDPDNIKNSEELYKLLNKLDGNGSKIATICSGTLQLLNSGILNNRKYTTTLDIEKFSDSIKTNNINETCVCDKNIITAKPNGYVDFALEIGKIMDIYENEADYNETVDFFKYFKST